MYDYQKFANQSRSDGGSLVSNDFISKDDQYLNEVVEKFGITDRQDKNVFMAVFAREASCNGIAITKKILTTESTDTCYKCLGRIHQCLLKSETNPDGFDYDGKPGAKDKLKKARRWIWNELRESLQTADLENGGKATTERQNTSFHLDAPTLALPNSQSVLCSPKSQSIDPIIDLSQLERVANLVKSHVHLPCGNWHESFACIAQDNSSIFAILEYAKREHQYDYIKQIWIDSEFHVYTLIYGLWGDTVKYLNWLHEKAKLVNDFRTVIESLAELCWLKILMSETRNLNKIASPLIEIWDCFQDKRDSTLQPSMRHIASYMASLKIKQRQTREAMKWIEVHESYIEKINLDKYQLSHCQVLTNYYKAEVFYADEKYDHCYKHIEVARHLASEIHYTRALMYINLTIVDLLMKEGKYYEAERNLYNWIESGQCQTEKRCLAFHQYQMALVQKSRKNQPGVKYWGKQAWINFFDLRMPREIELVEQLLTQAG